MAFTNDTRNKLDDAQAQIARLRDQVEALMKDRVSPAMSDFAGRANPRFIAPPALCGTRRRSSPAM